MATVTIVLPPGSEVNSANQKVTLTANGQTVTLPITDPKVDMGNLAPNWVEVPKPGLVEPPFLVRGPRPLRQISLSVTLVGISDMLSSIEKLLITLYTIMQADRITLAYGLFETSPQVTASGGFACVTYQPTVTMRDPVTNQAIQATANIVLKEANPPPPVAGVGANPRK